MGQPKKQRRKYSTPTHMYKGREGEKELIGAYGLKNAKELWKSKSEVARIRALARKLLASPDEKVIGDFTGRLKRVGLITKEAKLEDVLATTLEGVLDRRLQTVVYKKSLTTTIKQARQEIVHGHIAVNGRRMTAPGHLTTLEEAESVDFYAGSPLRNPEHPIRKIEKKASSEERVKAEDVKPPSERPNEAGETRAESTPVKPVEGAGPAEEVKREEPKVEEVKDKKLPEAEKREEPEEKPKGEDNASGEGSKA